MRGRKNIANNLPHRPR